MVAQRRCILTAGLDLGPAWIASAGRARSPLIAGGSCIVNFGIARVGSLIIVVFFAWFTADAQAAESGLSLRQMLLMPGKLIEGHAEFEADCDKCHANFDKANQTPLCLECHEEIDADVQQRRRFHGRMAGEGHADCVACHSDHKGRDAEITGLDRDHFAHDATDFPLLGAHGSLHCDDCHSVGSRFREAEADCAGCHDDVHQGKLGQDCKSCHAETGWQARVFDHETTGFPLTGAHADSACSACHIDQRFEGASPECAACHLGKDRHLGVFGRQCESCHTVATWKDIRFDHNHRTDFPLHGRHGRLACQACHRDRHPLELPTACIDCHSADDVHRRANGEDCAGCHEAGDWRTVRFDHQLDTAFPLVGAHQDVACASCHAKGRVTVGPVEPRDCADCHGPSDPHLGQLGPECRQCHGQDAWDRDVVFSHDFSSFPLTGAHQGLPCGSCHFSSAFQEAGKSCTDCHKGDDAHSGVFGEACAECHNTAAWISWNFDHDRGTEYPLTGAHADLACGLCHEPGLRDPAHPSESCVSCHAPDDVHRGDFGRDCGRCHDTEAFNRER